MEPGDRDHRWTLTLPERGQGPSLLELRREVTGGCSAANLIRRYGLRPRSALYLGQIQERIDREEWDERVIDWWPQHSALITRQVRQALQDVAEGRDDYRSNRYSLWADQGSIFGGR